MEVFYDNSPSEPLIRSDDRAMKWTGKPSRKRRKVCAAMDASPYHAHVMWVAEAEVIANDLSNLPSHYLEALLDAGYFPSSLTSPQATPDEQIPNNSSTHKLGERYRVSETLPVNEPPVLRIGRIPAPDASTYHPRPESSDLWEEEDSRRIRFALQDESDDHIERLRHSYSSTASTQHDDTTRSSELATSHVIAQERPSRALSVIHDQSEVILNPHPAAPPVIERYEIPLPPPPPLPSFSAGQVFWDDDLLAVDDHRRSYDFADFMDRWLSEAGHDKHVPAFEAAPGPSLWRRRQCDYVRTDARHWHGMDVQGLRWESFGVERGLALTMRRLLHPQRPGGMVEDDVGAHDNQSLHYKPRAFAPSRRARSCHYQLRNMTAASSGRDVYYAAGSKVKKASLACPSAEQTTMDLAKPSRSASPFKITCLANSGSSDGPNNELLIAGGFNGEFAVLNLSSAVTTKPDEGMVSHAKDGIVNHISTFLDRRSGSLQAAFCSNDHSLRIMDLGRQHFTNTFAYDSAINCSTMPPDSRLRALVHDGSDTLITNAETGEILVRLEAHTDFAFACDWSPCGRYLATGAEDCQVIIWDARNWSRPLHKLDSVISCARSMHFTDDGALVIAESEDVVSVVDTARFGLRQDIRFFGSIAGVSLVGGGAEMVVANADETVGGLMSFERVSKERESSGIGQLVQPGGRWSRRRPEYEDTAVDTIV